MDPQRLPASPPGIPSTLHILLVAEEGTTARQVRAALEGALGPGVKERTAETLAEGRRAVKRGGIDLVLLDLSVPGADGVDPVGALRAHTHDTPIITLIDPARGDTIPEALEAGAQDYLFKGEIDIDGLRRATQHALARIRLEQCLRYQCLRPCTNRLQPPEQWHEESWLLAERVKENQCLLEIIEICQHSEWDDDRLLETCAARIPSGWQAPSETGVRIRVGDRTHTSPGFRESDHRLTAPIPHERQPGRIEVYRWTPAAASLHRPVFLEEERALLLAIATQVGQALNRRHQDALRRKADEELRLAASVFAAAQEGVIITDADNRILDVNPAFTVITRYERDEVLGRSPDFLSSEQRDSESYAELWRTLDETSAWRGEAWNRRKSGEIYPVQLSITAVRSSHGVVTHYVAVFSDISQIKAQEQQLKLIAHYDPLTGLPNRRLLVDRIQLALAQTRRSGGNMAVAVLDLDDFKPINDTHGHEAGDHVLKEVGRRLSETLRGGDTAARLGGDEFVLVLMELTDAAHCAQALERVIAAIAAPIDLPSAGPVTVSASLGATLFPLDGGETEPDTLLRRADRAMYIAKQHGKNRYNLFGTEPY